MENTGCVIANIMLFIFVLSVCSGASCVENALILVVVGGISLEFNARCSAFAFM